MNQSRLRKPSAVGESARPRSLKVSGDAKNMTRDLTKETKEHLKSHYHDHNKPSIPKNMRYDLENALVGLCDVWFEDIKPYLLRNNIKLHVQCDGGAGAAEAAAGGDRGGRLPVGARGCSHVDPGAATDRRRRRTASSAGFSTAQRGTLKARLPKPPQRHCKGPCRRPSATTLTENHRNSDEGVLLRNHAGSPSVVPFKVPLEAPYTMTQLSYLSSPSPDSYEVSSAQTTPKMKHQSTQTEIRPTRRRSRKRLRAKSPAKARVKPKRKESPSPRHVERERSPSPRHAKRQKSPSPIRRRCSPKRHHRSSTIGQKSAPSPARQLRTNSSSPVRRKRSRTLGATSPVGRQKSPAKKAVNSVPPDCIEYYCDHPQCQCKDELENIIIGAFGSYPVYETPKTEKNPATLKHKSSSPKKERAKTKPPWR